MDGVLEDKRKLEVKELVDRGSWRKVLREAEAHIGL
jgi:hypothetical protein